MSVKDSVHFQNNNKFLLVRLILVFETIVTTFGDCRRCVELLKYFTVWSEQQQFSFCTIQVSTGEFY